MVCTHLYAEYKLCGMFHIHFSSKLYNYIKDYYFMLYCALLLRHPLEEWIDTRLPP